MSSQFTSSPTDDGTLGSALPSPGDAAVRSLSPAQRHRSYAVIIGLGVVCAVDTYIMSGLITPIRADLGLGDEGFGRITALFTIGSIVGAPFFGFLTGMFGRRPVLIGAVLFWSIVSSLGATAAGLAGLLLWRCLTGFGEAAYQSLAPGWICDLYDRRWRNLAFSVFMVKNKIGASIAIAAGAYVAATYGWRMALLLSGLPGLFLALLLIVTPEPVAGASDGIVVSLSRPSLREQLSILAIPSYVTHLAALSLFFAGTATALIWSPAYLHRAFGLSNEAASSFLAAAMMTAIPLSLSGGFLMGKLVVRRPGVQTTALAVTTGLAAFAYAAAFASTHLVGAETMLVVAIFAAGSTTGSLTALLVETVPAHLRSSGGTMGALLGNGLANTIAPWVLGALSDHYGLARAIFLGPTVYALASLIWLFAALSSRADRFRRAKKIYSR